MRTQVRVNYNKQVLDRQPCIAGQPVITDFLFVKCLETTMLP